MFKKMLVSLLLLMLSPKNMLITLMLLILSPSYAKSENCIDLFEREHQISVSSTDKSYNLTVKQDGKNVSLTITGPNNNIIFQEKSKTTEGYGGFFKDTFNSVRFSHNNKFILLRRSVYKNNVFHWFTVINLETGNIVEFKKTGRRLLLRGNAFFINDHQLIIFSQNITPHRPLLLDANTGQVTDIYIVGSGKEGVLPYENAFYQPDTAIAFTTGVGPDMAGSNMVSSDKTEGLYIWNFLNILSSGLPKLKFPTFISLNELLSNSIKPSKIVDLNLVFSPTLNKYYGTIAALFDNAKIFSYFVEIDLLSSQVNSLGGKLISTQSEEFYTNLLTQVKNNLVLITAESKDSEKRQILLRVIAH